MPSRGLAKAPELYLRLDHSVSCSLTIRIHNPCSHAPELLHLLKVEDKKRKRDGYSFCSPADVESLLWSVLTFNFEFTKTRIHTFVFVDHKTSFGQCLLHRTVEMEVVHSAGKLLNRIQDAFNLFKVKG